MRYNNRLMRREWLIVLGVLLPCVALFAAGSMWPSEHSAPPSPTITSAVPLETAGSRASPVSESLDAAAFEEKLSPARPAPEIEAAVNAVTPEITACFQDNGVAHLHGHIAVTIAFQPTREGRFHNVGLETKVSDPRLAACLEDVFEEVAYVPSGRETFKPAKHTFIFDAPRR